MCFIEVEDGRMLGVRLDNIVVAGKKLHVNLPRFQREQKDKIGNGGASQHRFLKRDLYVKQRQGSN